MLPKPPPDAPSRRPWWLFPFLLLALAGLGSWTLVRLAHELSPARALDAAGARAQSLLDRFLSVHSEQHVQEFLAGVPTGRDDLRLAVQTVDLTKVFYLENTWRWNSVNLGSAKVALIVPARIHYAIDLSGRKPVRFHFDRTSGDFTAEFPDPEVLAAELLDEQQRSLIDTTRAQRFLSDADELLQMLERRKRQAVRQEAARPEMIARVRPAARTVLARFVANYLDQQQLFGQGSPLRRIRVRFAGDLPGEIPVFYDRSALGLPGGPAAEALFPVDEVRQEREAKNRE